MNKRIKESSGSFAGVGTRRRALANTRGEDVEQRLPTSARPDQVAINPLNPRTFYDPAKREELTESIRKVGQLQPAIVMTRDAFVAVVPEHEETIGAVEYVVLAGSSRLLSVREAEADEFLFQVNNRPRTREEIIEFALVENVHRADLTPLEEAETVQALCEVYGSQQKVADRLGKSQGWVSQRLSLRNLVPEVRQDLQAGKVTVRQARDLARMEPEDQADARARDYYPVIPEPPRQAPVDASSGSARPETDSEPEGVVNPVDSQGPEGTAQERSGGTPKAGAAKAGIPEPDAPEGSPEGKPVDDKEPGSADESADRSVQLMLDLKWEPKEAADEIVSAYGRERAEELAAAILERL